MIVNKENKQKRYAFILYFLIILIYHIIIPMHVGDDSYFSTVIGTEDLLAWTENRWYNWSARFIIDIFCTIFTKYTVFWYIIDIMIWISIPILLFVLFKDRGYIFSCCYVLMYPFCNMGTAGWVATTLNYLWPLTCILIFAIIVQKMITYEHLSAYLKILCVPIIAYASNFEICAIIMLMLMCFVFVFNRKKLVSNLFWFLLYIVIDVFSIILYIKSPGVKIRFMKEVADRVPNFSSFSMIDKLYFGIENVERVFLENLNYIFFPFCLVLLILIYKRTRSYLKILCTTIPTLIIFCYNCLAVDSNSFTKIFVKSDKEFFVEWNSYITYLNIIYIILVIICILLSLYWIFEDEFMIFIKCAFVLGVGFFSAVGMGFSPTLYATGERAFLFFYFALIYVGVQLCLTADKNKLFSLLEKRLMDTAIAFWTLKNILLTVLLLI